MSPFYLITATREIEYQVEVEADDVDSAIEKVKELSETDNFEKYVYEHGSIDVLEVEPLEED